MEDDDKLANLVSEFFSAVGFEPQIEARGDSAPARILAEQPDLVVSVSEDGPGIPEDQCQKAF